MDHKQTQEFIMGQFARGDIPAPGPLRWVRRADKGKPPKLMLQQQWRGTVSGSRIWVDVPVDEESAGGG